MGPSSNGRTLVFHTSNVGSTPTGPNSPKAASLRAGASYTRGWAGGVV